MFVYFVHGVLNINFEMYPPNHQPAYEEINHEPSIIYDSEKFFISPSGKYKLIVWLEKTGVKKRILGKIVGPEHEYEILNFQEHLSHCWAEDCSGHDYFIYDSKNVIQLDTNTIKYNPSVYITEDDTIATEISPDKKHIAFLARFKGTSFDIHIVNFDSNTATIKHYFKILDTKCIDFKWLSNDCLLIKALGEYNKQLNAYSIKKYQTDNRWHQTPNNLIEKDIAIECEINCEDSVQPDITYRNMKKNSLTPLLN